MPKFSYTVINEKRKKLTGTIDAKDETAARQELNKLGFPVIDIQMIGEETVKEVLGEAKKYEFRAVDQNGRRVIGTITGEQRYQTFKRLVNEYHFSVESLVLSSASIEEKKREEELGVIELYTQLKKENEYSSREKNKQISLEKKQEEKEKYIRKQVDFVLEKVQRLIKNFADQIKPNDRDIIQKKADRLVRVKLSSNLEYIKELTEDLLKFIQNQEIYLTQSTKAAELNKFKLEIKKLLVEIHEEKLQPTLRQKILAYIQNYKQKYEDNEKKFWEKTYISLLNTLEEIITEPPEIMERKEKLRMISRQLRNYYKIWFFEKNPQIQTQAKRIIFNLRQDKALFKNEIKEIIAKFKEKERLEKKDTAGDKFSKTVLSLLGWVLLFYTLYFHIATYITPEHINREKIRNIMELSQTTPFLKLLTITFLLYMAGQSKRSFFPRNTFAGFLTCFTTIISIVLIAFNF